MYLSSLIYCNEEIKYRIGVWCEPNEVWFYCICTGHKSNLKIPATDFQLDFELQLVILLTLEHGTLPSYTFEASKVYF